MFPASSASASAIPRPGGPAAHTSDVAVLMPVLLRGDDRLAQQLLSSWPAHDTTLARFRTASGESALHVAARGRSRPEVMRMLAERGVDPYGVTEAGASVLHYAVQGAAPVSVAALQWLLRTGGPTLREHADALGRTALMDAALEGRTAAVAFLVAADAAVQARDNAGTTALHLAAAAGSTAVIEVLLAAGAEVDARDKRGATPLMRAVAAGHRQAVLSLLLAGTDIAAADGVGGTALMYAVANGHAGLADLLLSGGAAWHPCTDEGWNALTLAARAGNAEILRVLVDHGANPAVPDGAGRLAWQVAVGQAVTQPTRAARVAGNDRHVPDVYDGASADADLS